ncbi:MAG: CRISPR-associated endonuclease Cas1 [Syntrophobacteraceae bacterium]
MSVAYVLEQNAVVSREGERLLIKKERTILHTLHLFKIEQLVLFGSVSITPAAISCLLQNGIDTVFMSKNGKYKGRLQPAFGKNITIRCEQFKKLNDDTFRLDTARRLVEGKLANMRALLLRLNRSREKLALDDRILGLKQIALKAAEAEDLSSLMGFEGRGAVLYFDGFSKGFLGDGFRFERRTRRPPTDPVNALLSLGYAFLYNNVTAAVNLVGFDPYLGCLHSVEYGRPSLPLDLMEEWRSVIVDSLVLSVFNMKTITADDFLCGADAGEVEEEAEDIMDDPAQSDSAPADSPAQLLPVRLTDAGFRKFLAQFERKMAEKVKFHIGGQHYSYRDCIREQIRHFARYIRGEDKAYQPFSLR